MAETSDQNEPSRAEHAVTTEHDGRVLLQELYTELRKLADARLRRLRPGQTLQPTALVHEAYLRLMNTREPAWNGRAHFFGAAARAMRNILVDRARRQHAEKHGNGVRAVNQTITIVDDRGDLRSAEELLALHEALEKLQQEHPQSAELVLLRYFAGLSMAEIAEMQGVPLRQLERKWRFTRAWLKKTLRSP
jgi:RNA polymerase sigma factor (TIGR02999 family)